MAFSVMCAMFVCCAAGATASGRPETAVADDAASARRRMVEQTIAERGVHDRRVLDAMMSVQRHLFVPDNQAAYAYEDTALPIGFGQTISQPYVVAYMTELLALDGSEKVLEIGTGSGYQAAILSRTADTVYTIETIPELAVRARDTLDRFGYAAVQSMRGDGYFGWEDAAPFDAMIVTAAADHVPPPLLAQLKPGGRLVMPVGPPFGNQTLLLIAKDASGRVHRTPLISVRFVPMTGRALDGSSR